MNKERLVDANGFSTRVAVVEDGSPVELYVEQESSQRLVGNIYNGRVQNVLPGMQAAFIDIGLERNAFLYAGDIVLPDGSDDEVETPQESKNIRDLLKPGQTITKAMLAPADDSAKGYRKIKVPAAGVNVIGSDLASRQMKIDD